jgi:NAD(P)-dependent dehydrogenase (short-subunit alcohol dehydrogenase family)
LSGEFGRDDWAIILGGSSGFGLATAKRLAREGMSLGIVHRDRRGAMSRIEPEFEKIRAGGGRLLTFNADALDPGKRVEILERVEGEAGRTGRVRVMLHSIAFGNLKLIAPEKVRPGRNGSAAAALAAELGLDEARVAEAANRLFAAGRDELHTIASPPHYNATSFIDREDLDRTIYSMGTSLLDWTRAVLDRGLFAEDARVFGLTSEGNQIAWKGYAAVAAAKVALESIGRTIAVELAPYGIRCNVIQAGVTETAALAAIPGSAHLKAQARLRNPFGRLTTPEDVADVIYLLSRKEAAWINGEVIRVDGGEHVSGALG